jgi:integrase
VPKPKSKRLQLTGVHGKRVNLIFPPSVTKEDVGIFKTVARRVIQSQRANLPLHPSDLMYFQMHGDLVKRKFALLGVRFGNEQTSQDASCVLSTLLSRYTASRRGETERKLVDTARRLERFFGPSTDIRNLTKTQALEFQNWLIEKESLAENSTARRTIAYASQIMQSAMEEGLIAKNPFKSDGLRKAVVTNTKRHHYITPEQTKRLWAALPSNDDRIRFILLRYLGLRAPSELDSLTWDDFDWVAGTVTIRSAKTRHTKTQGIRTCPIVHPDVLPILKTAYDERAMTTSKLVPRITAPALRRRVITWLGRAGLDLWPQLLVNFRRSAVTDALDILPPHVVSAYFGHSEIISEAHYAMRTTAHAGLLASATSILGSHTHNQAYQQIAQ